MFPASFRGSQAQADYAMTLPEILENFALGIITQSERFSLNEYLHTAKDDLAQCEAEINEHKGAIMVLEAKRRKIQNFIEKSYSLLAPVHRMPPEILSNIFSFCCQQAVPQYLIPRLRPPLVSLSFVCQRWRDTVLSIPSLWSVLKVNFEPWKWDFEQLERVVAMYLTRSKAHPLTLYLDLTSTQEEDRETSEKCIAILRRIVRESHRWETAELDISPTGLCHPVFQPIIGHLPLLKKLALSGREDEIDLFNENIALNLDALFSTCPSLEHILVNEDIASYGPVVPWHQIRTIDLKMFYDVDVFNSALAKCPEAERLYLADIEFAEDSVHPGPSMPNIRHLSLESCASDELFGTLDCLNLPGLTSVRLQGHIGYLCEATEDTNRHFKSFFDRTSGSIVSLFLDFPISDQVIISLLRMVPTLEQLDIAEKYHREYKTISTYFWKSLSIVRPTSFHIVVPRLRELNLTFYGNDLDDDALLETLASRLDPGGDIACLKIITLDIMGAASKKLEEGLGYLKTYSRSKGTRLSVECFKRP